MKMQLRIKMLIYWVGPFLMFSGIGNVHSADVQGVSGNMADGQDIVISGYDFGPNGPNLILFDDFESGTPGETIMTGSASSKVGSWGAIDNNPYYTDSASVSGELAFQADQSTHYAIWAQADLPSNTRDVFLSWWLFLPAGDNAPGEGSANGRNWKQMWLQGESTGDDDLVLPSWHYTWQIGGNENDPGYSNYTTVNFQKGEWKRLWIWIKGGYQDDGELAFWELTGSGVIQREDDKNVNTLKSGGAFERVRVNGYGRQAPNCHPTFDDVYVAAGPYAQARIEVGNSSTYANSTNITILTPTSWNDNEIVATVRQGVFNSGDSAYLFVFDADGNASNGFPVTFGEGMVSDIARPNPPKNVTVD